MTIQLPFNKILQVVIQILILTLTLTLIRIVILIRIRIPIKVSIQTLENKNGIQIEEDNYVDTEGNVETETTKPQAEENKTSSNKKEEKEQDENVTKEEEKIEIPFIHTKIEKSTLVKILIGLSIFAVILFIAIRKKIKD